jgi:diaminohydroxyphosphoribosylaminopyrimidine deaminase / 5-amino-6-(5-phosphoribosylamino)uracil reductase
MSGSLSDRDWMMQAIDLSRLCPPSKTAFSVGAIIVDCNGQGISQGYSRESDREVHAEEAALAKVDPEDPRLKRATIYSSLEPCCQRKSRQQSCSELIIEAGLARVVIAWREPAKFVADRQGVELLKRARLDVSELDDLAHLVQAANSHLV